MKKEKIYKIFSHLPTLTTERLTMRKLLVGDADDMYEYACDENVTRYLTWSPHRDRDYTLDYLRYIGTRYRTGDFFDWALIDNESGKMIGTCGFTRFDFFNDGAEVGYVINPRFSGRGMATEALGKIIEFGFEEIGLHRIECRYMVDNLASLKVMEKNGMTYEGIRRSSMLVKGVYRDIATCSILRDEYFGEKNC